MAFAVTALCLVQSLGVCLANYAVRRFPCRTLKYREHRITLTKLRH